jgi:hypothetical protein
MAQVQKAELVWAARALGMNNRLFTRQPRASDMPSLARLRLGAFNARR